MKLKLLIASLIFSNSVFATEIFCPEKVTCSQRGIITSCSAVDGNQSVWDLTTLHQMGEILNVDYAFINAKQNVNLNTFLSDCIYKGILGRITSYIVIETRDVNLITYDMTPASSWEINAGNIICTSPEASNCPYKTLEAQ